MPVLHALTPSEDEPPARRQVEVGRVVVGSLGVGLLAALTMVVTPIVPADDVMITGGVLVAFALGWALLAVLSTRFSDQPQAWAAAPALFFAAAGCLLLARPPAGVQTVVDWVWPPVLLGLVVVMTRAARRWLQSWTGRWLLSPVLVVTALVSMAGGYEIVQEAVDDAVHHMPGQLVDVGGHRLHLRCTGTGSPTVVLEPGLSEASPVMGWVTPAVAADTRVCVYDRAGRGWSEPTRPLDGAQTAADLHTLLHRGHIEGPYVLAGHSFGGLYVLAFADAYPDEVAGLVLIDSTAPKPGQPAPAASDDDLTSRLFAVLPVAARLGLARLYARSSYDTLPVPARQEAVVRAARPAHVRSFLGELGQGPAAVRQAAALADLQGKPLIVLTAGRGHDASWRAEQDQLATLSSNSRHRLVPEATHASLLIDPVDAAATSQAVRDVVVSARRR